MRPMVNKLQEKMRPRPFKNHPNCEKTLNLQSTL